MTHAPLIPETIHLRAMPDAGRKHLPDWEAEWVLFGPIPNQGDGVTWPGEVGFNPLPLDGATAVPETVEILGQVHHPLRVTSRGGVLRFHEIYEDLTGLPIVYMLTTVHAPHDGVVPLSFGANWGTQWWVNGAAVFDSRVGNFADPELRTGQQFLLPVKPGENLVVVKVVAGTAEGWMITLSRLEMLPPPSDRSDESDPSDRSDKSDELRAPVHGPPLRNYTRAGLRIEQRPGPVPAETSELRERAMAEHGVQAHWIGIVDPTGSPYADSDVLSPGERAVPGNAALLRKQVAEIHRHGMVAMTWFPGVHSKSTATAHPDWRAVPLRGTGPGGGPTVDDLTAVKEDTWQLCPNSPYGDALTAFVLESLERYELDGFWFDGTSRAGGDAPTCVCAHCGRRFRAVEGLDLPVREDWNDPVFRRWVAWRYRDYMAFWGRLAGTVRQRFPQARIVVNHLHRLCHNWYGGMPIDSYEADVVAGSESQDDPFIGAFHARQQNAYGRVQAEVWMGVHKLFTKTAAWPGETEPVHRYMHHALCCMTAGAMPSFGTPDPAEKLTDAYDLLGGLVNPRHPFLGGRPVPYAALLLSQQAETFHFSRRADRGFPRDYWYTVLGWHHLLMEKQLPQELVFDSAIGSRRLAACPVLIAPCAVALSDAQVEALQTYVHGGGVLVCGPELGGCDEWGETADASRVARLLGRAAILPPEPDADLGNDATEIEIRPFGSGQVVMLSGNPGLRFLRAHSAELADELGALLCRCVPPPLTIDGPRRLHVGFFRRDGKYLLHLQNFIAYSESEAFPNPVLMRPEPIRDLRVVIRGCDLRRATLPIADGHPDLEIVRGPGECEFRVPEIRWGELVELEPASAV